LSLFAENILKQATLSVESRIFVLTARISFFCRCTTAK